MAFSNNKLYVTDRTGLGIYQVDVYQPANTKHILTGMGQVRPRLCCCSTPRRDRDSQTAANHAPVPVSLARR